jgi:hypothetical protein
VSATEERQVDETERQADETERQADETERQVDETARLRAGRSLKPGNQNPRRSDE